MRLFVVCEAGTHPGTVPYQHADVVVSARMAEAPQSSTVFFAMLSSRSLIAAPLWVAVALVAALFFLMACEEEPTDPQERFERLGQRVYNSYCATCHGANGQGVPGAFPTLRETEWVVGDKGRLIRLVLHGVGGEMEVLGETYNNVMIAHGFLTDEQIAAVLTHIRQNWGNDAETVRPAQVQRVRQASTQEGIWEASDLWEATGIPGEDPPAEADVVEEADAEEAEPEVQE